MTALADEIKAIIRDEGPIGVERYMRLCLQHPLYGYYTTREAIGRAGDFVTAPEIDQMFGEILGLWAAQVWLDIGAPQKFRLVELGPGRGTLMADVLRATRIVPGFLQAVSVDLVETSPRLAAEQRARLEGAAQNIVWHQTIEDVPDGPAIVIANEFFDALPVRHYLRGARGWHERVVGLGDDGALAFGAAPEPIDIAATSGTPGQILEIGHEALRVMTALAGRIARDGGALLALDYGHTESSLGETLQAMAGHAYADPLAAPGEADLTAHVDFAALSRAARAAGAAAHGPVEQGIFLRRHGIAERADRLKARANAAQAAALDAALARLAGPGSNMAVLFKVLAVMPNGMTAPPGFS